VVLCCFEGERWLPALLASIADQTLLPDELVVCDDGSTDRSVAIVERFAETAPFTVRIERNPERLGSTRNFAHGLSLAHGRVVALADQDDVWYPGKLAVMAWEFEQDPTISMVFSDADLMDSSGTPLGRKLWDTRLVGRTLRRHAVVPEDLFARRALTTGCTMAFRRRVVDAALPFPEELDDPWAPMRHDRWLSLVAAAVGTVRAIEEPLLAFRVHPNQETGVLVGSQLHRALARAATRVGRHSNKHEHAGRAAQLRAAAQRADLVGDFREAATLRTVADHQAARAAIGEGNQRASDVVRAALAGAYRGDPLSPLAVGADLVRSVLPAVDAPQEPAP
jgi:glycosyltransferase involved in cell wall biosynthesis